MGYSLLDALHCLIFIHVIFLVVSVGCFIASIVNEDWSKESVLASFLLSFYFACLIGIFMDCLNILEIYCR